MTESFDELDELAASAPQPTSGERRRPSIRVGRDLTEMVSDAVAALVTHNGVAPRVFRYTDALARVARVEDPDGRTRTRIKQYEHKSLVGELARAAEWYARREMPNGEWVDRPVPPNVHVVGELLSSADLYTELPPLDQVIGCPIFARDGSLQTTSGYSEKTRTWYEPVDDVVIPEVPTTPTSADAERARTLIVDELLGEFPFDGEADRAHAVGLIITLIARRLVRGHVPMHGFDAPTEGTGKTLVVQAALTLVGGVEPLLMSAPKSSADEEWDKRIVSALRSGRQFIVWDNVSPDNPLSAPSLAKLLTSAVYGGRLLGFNVDLELPVHLVSVYTGNNVSYSREVARRLVRCRLNAHAETPSQGRTFRHDPLIPWVLANRGELLWAAYVLVRRWLVEGRPAFEGTILGSYEEWSRIVGGVLDVADIKGFLGNREEVYDSVEEGHTDHAFVAAWWDRYQSQSVTAEQLTDLAHQHLGVTGSLGIGGPSAKSVGKILSRMRDKVYGSYEVVALKGRTRYYALVCPTCGQVGADQLS